ncbi:MAG: PH domain-containing protein [Dehalococcoidia bacterium]|nr:PH domain-containing protein [Dehalococcoidia bacterium]
MSSQDNREVMGETLYEARFDPKIASHGRVMVALWCLVAVAGILLIPFMLLFSLWYYPEYLRRISARLTTHAVEIRKGVFFRKESTIPLNRITDVRLHDGPVMRYYGLRGIRLETAGQSGQSASSEGDLVGVIDAVEFRDLILRQRQKVLGSGEALPAPAGPAGPAPEILTEIRDILARIEAQGRRDA